MANSEIEMVRAGYIADHCMFSEKHAYRYMRARGIHPIRILGIYHYPKKQVDVALERYVIKSRKSKQVKETYFKFDDIQMEIMKFCRGDYTNKSSKVLKAGFNSTTVHLIERNEYTPPHSGLNLFGCGQREYQAHLTQGAWY